jgi:hypothetical protein
MVDSLTQTRREIALNAGNAQILPDNWLTKTWRHSVKWTRALGRSCSASDQPKDVILAIADYLCRLAIVRPATVRAASVSSLEELQAAFRLAYREYLARRYCRPSSSQMHFGIYSLLPESQTFVLKQQEELVGTMSIIIDSPLGLPLEGQFPQEAAAFRKEGKKLAEVSLLALDSTYFSRARFSLLHFKKLRGLFCLSKAMMNYARAAKVSDLLIVVHPKHELLYSYMGFEVFGDVKTYPGACGNLALPMRLDLESMLNRVHVSGKDRYLFSNQVNELAEINPFQLDDQVIDFLLAAKPKLLDELSPAKRSVLRNNYAHLFNRNKGEGVRCSGALRALLDGVGVARIE